jgi:hypothetical protein
MARYAISGCIHTVTSPSGIDLIVVINGHDTDRVNLDDILRVLDGFLTGLAGS